MAEDIQKAHDSYQARSCVPQVPLQQPLILTFEPQAPGSHGKPGGGHHWLGGHLGLEGAEHWLHAKAGLLNLKVEAHQVAADAVDTAMEPVSHVGHHLSGLGTGLTVAASGLGVASGALGLVLLRNGAADLKEGIDHRNWSHAAEGVGSLVVGTRSVAAGAAMLGHLLPHPVLMESGALAGKLVQPLGLVHGAIDFGLGVKDVVGGVQSKDSFQLTQGALGMGVGASLMAAAAGGGVPALATAGLFLAGRFYHDISRDPKKAE